MRHMKDHSITIHLQFILPRDWDEPQIENVFESGVFTEFNLARLAIVRKLLPEAGDETARSGHVIAVLLTEFVDQHLFFLRSPHGQ